jgi:hypothetical protein
MLINNEYRGETQKMHRLAVGGPETLKRENANTFIYGCISEIFFRPSWSFYLKKEIILLFF